MVAQRWCRALLLHCSRAFVFCGTMPEGNDTTSRLLYLYTQSFLNLLLSITRYVQESDVRANQLLGHILVWRGFLICS